MMHMPTPLKLELSDEQRAALQHLRDHAHKPYIRERAAALLKIASGQSVRHVARSGLLKRHSHGTLLVWVERFNSDGLKGLEIKPGRGRRPCFSP